MYCLSRGMLVYTTTMYNHNYNYNHRKFRSSQRFNGNTEFPLKICGENFPKITVSKDLFTLAKYI